MNGAPEITYPRPLSEHEAVLFCWCADRLPDDDGVAFKEQLANCHVIDEDTGGLWFRVAPKTAPVDCQGFDLVYGDIDGGPAQFIIAFVGGHLNWVDRYRNDGADLNLLIPSAEQIRSWLIVPA